MFSAIQDFLRIDIAAMIASFAVAVFLLFGCSDSETSAEAAATGTPSSTPTEGPPSPDSLGAPGATLTSSQETVAGGIGTRCWAGACIDYTGPVTNADPLELSPGEAFNIEFEEATPAEFVLSLYPAPTTTPTPENGTLSWSIDPSTSTTTDAVAPAEPGRYIISAFARWDGKGDISYGWYVEVKS